MLGQQALGLLGTRWHCEGAQVAGVLAAEARQPARLVEQLLQRGGLTVKALAHVELVQLHRPLDEGSVEALLVAEVVVDRANGDIRLRRDLVHPRFVVAALEEVALGRVEDAGHRPSLAALRPREGSCRLGHQPLS